MGSPLPKPLFLDNVNLSDFKNLLTPEGQEILRKAEALAPRESDFLAHFSALSKRCPLELARAALETAILRREAGEKFPSAGQMYFTRPALEQATHYEVSNYRARRYQGFEHIAALGCSIGGDSLALAKQARLTGIDLDPLRLAMSCANLEGQGLGERTHLLQADLSAPLPLRPHSGLGLFFDPARRAEQGRVYSVRNYQPPLSILESWLADYPALGVKISPGVKMDELKRYDAEVEFISLRGELKEAVLWFGPLRRSLRQATLLPGPHCLAAESEISGRLLPLSEPRAYLYEPDPAVLRAGLVQPLGQQFDAAQLDPDIAYLTSDTAQPTPFARCWAVEDWLPFGMKRLRAVLRERDIGQVIVKKRGSPLQPESLIQQLRLKGSQQRVLFLTHLRGQPIVIICLPEQQTQVNVPEQ